MNDICADIGYKSLIHVGELLCGDCVEIVEQDDNSAVVVLADGLGSGVKANILSTLTSKIISTSLARGLSLEECVSTIAATLPVCSKRGVAYSTFTIIRLIDGQYAEIIQYDNPKVIFLRNGKNFDYPTEEIDICGKKILKSTVTLKENDIIIAITDGCTHAGMGKTYNFGWMLESIIKFLEPLSTMGYNAKTLAGILVDECDRLYGKEPGDDTTACIMKMRKRVPVNLLFGPPTYKEDCEKMMSMFFSNQGKHIVCGGTTSSLAAQYLNKPIKASLKYISDDMPPVGKIEGVDIVTEGVITVSKVLRNAKDYMDKNSEYGRWSIQRDGASLISRMLFEEATDINFFVGRAVNPAHQNPDLPINFNIKMNLVEELSGCLKQMGKRVKIIYF